MKTKHITDKQRVKLLEGTINKLKEELMEGNSTYRHYLRDLKKAQQKVLIWEP